MSSTEPREVRVAASDLPVPGQILVVEIRHHRVGLMRVGDEIHALADRCPHRGAPLCSAGEVVTDIQLAADGSLQLGAADSLIRCRLTRCNCSSLTSCCAD